MMEELGSESYPVRENGRNPVITRDVNEDRLLKVSEENLVLKKHLRKQEDRIRQLATKLVRVLGEKTKRTERDEILITDQKTRIDDLECQVHAVRSKLSVARQQLGSYTRLVPGSTRQGQPRPKSSRSPSVTPTVVPDQVTRLLLDAQGENHLLKDQVKHLQDRWQKTNQELMAMKEQIQLKEVEFNDELAAVRSQTLVESELKQKKLAENIQFIRLQRDSKKTASWLATYEAQCRTLETSLNSSKETIGQLELQVVTAQDELRAEQGKSLNLLKLHEENTALGPQLKEANAQIIALKDENKILKESNSSFMTKSLESGNRTKAIDQKEAELNLTVEKLEASLKNELKAKSELIAALTQEKAKSLAINQSMQILEKKCVNLESQLEDLAKLKDSVVAAGTEPELVIEKELVVKPCTVCPAKDQELAELDEKVGLLKAEMSKVKELLKAQVGINKEYQEEIEALTSQLANAEALHEKERRDLMYIFSDKTHKMAELEQSLETLTVRLMTAVPLALVPDLVDYESSKENVEIEDDHEADEETVGKVPGSASAPSEELEVEPIQSRVPFNDIQEDKIGLALSSGSVPVSDPEQSTPDSTAPTIKIYIEKFLATDEYELSNLFVTWEMDTLPRQYSSIVSNGTFEAEWIQAVDDAFRAVSIDVQLYQAVGAADSRLVALGKMNPGANQIAEMKSEITNQTVGSLWYSYVLKNVNEPLTQHSGIVVPEPTANHNLPRDFPEAPTPVPPVPIPRKFKMNVPSSFQQSTIPEPIESSSESLFRTKRKSILRRETASIRTNKRRVRVSDTIEERKFHSDSDLEISESLESELGQVTTSAEDVSRSVGQVLVKPGLSIGQIPKVSPVPSDISWKRRSRRISRQPATITDESDEVSSTISVGSECETSKNISDIETISEEPGTVAVTVEEISITVGYATFTAHSRVLSDPQVKRFFVEYQFLNYPAEELETDTAQPKPPIGRRAEFDFKKKFLIDSKDKRILLKEMILANKKLQFTLVTEPSDNDTIDCEDIGYAYVSLSDILSSGNDIYRKEIPIFDAETTSKEIGLLCISVLAFTALDAL